MTDATERAREVAAAASAWLRQCSSWMLENDLDMQCPMDVDPLHLADELSRLFTNDGLVRVPAVAAGDASHNWSERRGITCCLDCGIVRRRDRLNSLCKGNVKVALR